VHAGDPRRFAPARAAILLLRQYVAAPSGSGSVGQSSD
jgi:hypothetical protein